MITLGLKDAEAEFLVGLGMDFLIYGQRSSFCPNQHRGKLLTIVMLHKVPQSQAFKDMMTEDFTA